MSVHFNWYGQPDQPPIPSLIAVRASGRRTIELEFDPGVIVRNNDVLIPEVSDRYTPLNWTALSGANAEDGANPANYTLTRPSSGNLVGAGEAVDLQVVRVEEVNETASILEEGADSYVFATKVELTTDFQHTARADYVIDVANVIASVGTPPIGEGPNSETTSPWVGYVVSQVQRESLEFWDLVSEVHRRDDRDGTGDLRKFLTALQEVLDRVLEDIDAFFPDLSDIDRARDEFLDTILFDLGNPFRGQFDLTSTEKRKLATVLVQIYRQKGTCSGIVNVVQLFLGITLSGCQEPWLGADGWKLYGGSYGALVDPSVGFPFGLGVKTRLSPGEGLARNSFRLLSPITLTDTQREQIEVIAEYMKPAYTHFLGIQEP